MTCPSCPNQSAALSPAGRPSSLLDTRIIYCGDCLDQLRKLPDACVDLIYIDPPFNSNRNYEVFWGETKEKRAFETYFERSDMRGIRVRTPSRLKSESASLLRG